MNQGIGVSVLSLFFIFINMKYKSKSDAVLLLEDGTVFFGKSAGKTGTATGEICFNTGMTGYQEIFTDPSYFGQIMLTTNAHIGNYGIHTDELESDRMKISGLICKNFSLNYSRPDAQESIQDYFLSEDMVAISDVDTRALVRHIRDKGAMNGIISSEITDIETLKEKLYQVPCMEGLQLCDKVSTITPYFFGDENAKFKECKHLTKWNKKRQKLKKYNEVIKHKQFFQECKNHKILLKNLLITLKKQNKKISGYGASTKGNVLLQYCKIDSKILNFIAEVNKYKFNKYTPGTNIKIVSEKKVKQKKPDYMLVLPWHFKDHIIKREHKYLQSGGKLIFPLPDIEII